MDKRDSWLGEFELLVLMAVLRLGDNAYGMRVRQEIESRTGRIASLGAVYTTLDRMEAKGYVSSSVGGATPERGGRAKRFFRLEAAGASALAQTTRAVRSMATGLDESVGGIA